MVGARDTGGIDVDRLGADRERVARLRHAGRGGTEADLVERIGDRGADQQREHEHPHRPTSSVSPPEITSPPEWIDG